MTSCGQALADLTERLRDAGIDSARLDARVLLAHALGIDSMQVFSRPERVLTAGERTAIETLGQRRQRREPVSHIIGRREFWSLSFKVTADTLDPRPDTETLVEGVLDAIPDRFAPLRLLDFGTGSGCILLSLLSELPNATGLAIDVSAAALEIARENAASLGMAGRTRFVLGNWGEGLSGPFDIITSNPPYIPEAEIDGLEREVAGWEPRSALAGGADGLDCYRALAPDIARLLVKDGIAALEVGQGQDRAVADLMERAGLTLRQVRPDLAGIGRCVLLSQEK